jgi:uncharacterized membrane protein HdeD (DUF308 family)
MRTTFDLDPTEEMLGEDLARNWWVFALRAILALAVGVIALVLPGPTLAALVLLVGAYLVVEGVLSLVAALRAARRKRRWGASVAKGVVDLAAGVLTFFLPGLTLLGLVYLLGVWAIFTGVLEIVAGTALRRRGALAIIAGVLSVLLGIFMFILPIAGALVLAFWFGIYELAFGASMLMLAVSLRRRAPPTGPLQPEPHHA